MVPIERIIPINPYIFGSEATADTCDNIVVTCIYDEPLTPSGSNPRFFEGGSENAFYITKKSQDVENWSFADYPDADVIE